MIENLFSLDIYSSLFSVFKEIFRDKVTCNAFTWVRLLLNKAISYLLNHFDFSSKSLKLVWITDSGVLI